MKILLASIIGLLTIGAHAEGQQDKTLCKLGKDGRYLVELIARDPIADTQLFEIRTPGSAAVPIYQDRNDVDESNHLSRGSDVKAYCAGSPEKVLVISGDFTSNFIQAVVIRYNSRLQQLERLDFAERFRPSAIYLDDNAFSALIPSGQRETQKKYLLYTHDSMKGSLPYPAELDQPPAKDKWQTIELAPE